MKATQETAPEALNVVDPCVLALRDEILSGRLRPGDRLPSERDLAARFAVNRVSVRSALARLEAGGLLSVRQGSGYTVRSYLREGGPALLPAVLAQSDAAGQYAIAVDLLRVRRGLAVALLESLSERALSADSLIPLRAAIDTLAKAARSAEPMEVLARCDLEVLACLLTLSESTVLQLCLHPVVSVLHGFDALREAMYAHPKSNVLAWSAVLVALESGAPLDAVLLGPLLADRDAKTLARMARRANLSRGAR
ncbi:MAG: GntR family transcriptional regulator [Deltaproteobacteria bacterium]|nr:GntR family transcriptional regulator [Deltaproteobacteria bacterium]